MNVCTKFNGHPLIVEIFQTGPKWQTDSLIDISVLELCHDLPCKSNLVLLTDTEPGLVGADVLNSFVGVSCCNQTDESSLLL